MNTRDTVVQVRGVLRCAKMQHRTRTRDTRFGRTTGLPVPVRNPNYGCAITQAVIITGHCNPSNSTATVGPIN